MLSIELKANCKRYHLFEIQFDQFVDFFESKSGSLFHELDQLEHFAKSIAPNPIARKDFEILREEALNSKKSPAVSKKGSCKECERAN